MPSMKRLIFVTLLLPSIAQAQLDCIVATREEGFDPAKPGAAELQRAARAVAAIVQKNSVFMQGNKPVRVRTSISYSGWDRQSADVITTAYNEKAWVSGGCEVSRFADRGGGLSEGKIAIYINKPEAMLGGQLGDSELNASGMPVRLNTHAGFPIYAAGGRADSPMMLISRAGYEPWVPVTIAEMLDWRERELAKLEHEYEASVTQSSDDLDEAKIEEIYRSMRAANAAEAEKVRAEMLGTLSKMRAESTQQSGRAAHWMSQQRSAFNTYRASFTSAQLGAPGTISNSTTRDNVVRVDDPSGTLIARVDSRYAQRDPRRIHLLAVNVGPQPRTDPEYAWHQESLEALDYAALAAVISSE